MEKLNLQLFAEEQPAEEKAPEGAQEQPAQGAQTFTQADVDRMISKMAEKFEAKFSKRAEEAQRLASMTAEEKARHEIERTKQEIEEMKRSMIMEQNKAECAKILAEENPKLASLADFAVAEDAETMKRNLDMIKKTVIQVANEIADSRLKGYTPRKEAGLPAEITKETFAKMSLDQKQQLFMENRELYAELTK
jgi:hypothetical protein